MQRPPGPQSASAPPAIVRFVVTPVGGQQHIEWLATGTSVGSRLYTNGEPYFEGSHRGELDDHLPPGTVLTLKVWDAWSRSAEATVVVDGPADGSATGEPEVG